MKIRILCTVLCLATMGLATRAIAQSPGNLPDFYEEGQEQLEREIERLNERNPENVLTIEGKQLEWQEFTLKAGGFKVWMPGTPTEETQVLPTAAGNLEFKGLVTNQGSLRFIAVYSDYPNTTELGNPQAILTDVGDVIAKAVGFEVKGDRILSLEGYPGRELRLPSNSSSVTLRLYLVQQRLYFLGATDTQEGDRSEEVSKFLDSFQLIQNPAANSVTIPSFRERER